MSKKGKGQSPFPEGFDRGAIERETHAIGDAILEHPDLMRAIQTVREETARQVGKVSPVFEGDEGAVSAFEKGITRQVLKGISTGVNKKEEKE